MAGLAADRNTPRRTGEALARPVKAGVQIYAGALVCLDSAGRLVPGSASTTLVADGRSQDNVLGGATDGAVTGHVHPGIFRWDNSTSGDLIAAANIGANCYVVDDHTVALTNGGGTRSVAGKIVDVDSVGVWVSTGIVFGI